MLLKGLKFGMLLQLAIGPVCLFIFQTASRHGFYAAEAGVIGVALVDGIYMLIAMLGTASLLEKPRIKPVLIWFSAAVLFIFGLSMILSFFQITLLPDLDISGYSGRSSSIIYAIVLTASSPLTILFWASVFTSKITEAGMIRARLYPFALGALIATLLFLSLIAMAGSWTYALITPFLSQILNFIVGIIIVGFAMKMIFKHKS